MDSSKPGSQDATNTDRNVLSFGCELEFVVAWIFDDETDPNGDNPSLAPVLKVPRDLTESIELHIHGHLQDTLREAGFRIQDDELSRFGIAVKPDITVKETNGEEQWKGYRWQGCELNSSASWTSAIAFQELELVTKILLRVYRIRVNASCGLQFHIGNGLKPLNTQTVRRIGALLWCVDPIASQIHPPQRSRAPMSLSLRDYGRFARAGYISDDVKPEEFFKGGTIGKPAFGGTPRMASIPPARHRRFPSSRLPTSLAEQSRHEELEKEFPDGFYWTDLNKIPLKAVEYSTLDGVWRFLACDTTCELKDSISPPGKPNYSFTGYESNMNPGGRDEWLVNSSRETMTYDKLTIEFRQAIGSMDAEWICAWGRICAALVLFAKNASTIDFFGMVMRLAQAQGDFGDPGPAPYDFIDFLDDLGCFAEAELLEEKLQDRRLFWFPCRRNETAPVGSGKTVRPPPRDDGGWPIPSGGKPAAPPSWGNESDGKPVDKPNSEAPEEQDDKWYPYSDHDEDKPIDSTDQNLSVVTEATKVQPGHAPLIKPEGEQPVESITQVPSETENGTATDDTASNANQQTATGQQNHPVPQKGVTPSNRPQLAQDAYSQAFPHGHTKMFASTEGLLCGPRTIVSSFKVQQKELTPPTVEELMAVANAQLEEFKAVAGTDNPAELGVELKNFTVDQLGGILRRWAQEKHGLKIGLGVLHEEKEPALELVMPEDGDDCAIWIHNNDQGGKELMLPVADKPGEFQKTILFGHWSPLRPKPDPNKSKDKPKDPAYDSNSEEGRPEEHAHDPNSEDGQIQAAIWASLQQNVESEESEVSEEE